MEMKIQNPMRSLWDITLIKLFKKNFNYYFISVLYIYMYMFSAKSVCQIILPSDKNFPIKRNFLMNYKL